jgi:menaquinone-9 beta-reductase
MRMAKPLSEIAPEPRCPETLTQKPGVDDPHEPGAPGLAFETWAPATEPAGAAAPHDTSDRSVVDLCVVGGGPAGLACAIAAALKGLSVRVVDGMKPPIDKACGEGLLPDTLTALAKLGVRLDGPVTHQDPADSEDQRPTIGVPLEGIRFLDAGRGDERSSGAVVQASFPSAPGLGVRRILLHQRLLARAAELGVNFHWQTVAKGIEEIGQGTAPTNPSGSRVTVHTNRGPLHARFLVGADGNQSRVRGWSGLDRGSITARRIGLRQHFDLAPWTSFVEVHWSDHGQAYVTPVSPQQVCVAFIARQKFPSVAAALACFPELQTHLGSAPRSDLARGSITRSHKLKRVTRNHIALLGDASGSVDAVTGEGLSLCFRQALALADALAAGDLKRYQKAHAAMRRLPHLMAGTLLLLDRSPRLRARSLALLERHPQLFARLLELHIGASPLGAPGRSPKPAAAQPMVSA